jgi:hypothetical protein
MSKNEKVDDVSTGGRRVDNHGPILMSPGGSFNIPKKEEAFGCGLSPATSPKGNSPASSSSGKFSDSSETKTKVKDISESVRQLFGGALSMQVPASFQDVSNIREVW